MAADTATGDAVEAEAEMSVLLFVPSFILELGNGLTPPVRRVVFGSAWAKCHVPAAPTGSIFQTAYLHNEIVLVPR